MTKEIKDIEITLIKSVFKMLQEWMWLLISTLNSKFYQRT